MTAAGTKKRPRKRKALPKPPRKVRVAVYAPPINDPEAMATLGNKLTAAAAANTGEIKNPEYIPALTTAMTTLTGDIVAAEGGTDADQTALLNATIKVHEIIVQHAGWVQAQVNSMAPADAIKYIILAGFQVAKNPQRKNLTAPELSNLAPTVVHFDLPKVDGAVMWFSEVSTDGGKTYARSSDTELRKGDITGLPSGQTVSVRLRPYVRGTGYQPWTMLSITVT